MPYKPPEVSERSVELETDETRDSKAAVEDDDAESLWTAPSAEDIKLEASALDVELLVVMAELLTEPEAWLVGTTAADCWGSFRALETRK